MRDAKIFLETMNAGADPLLRRLEWEEAQSLAGGAIAFLPDPAGEAIEWQVVEALERSSTPKMRQFTVTFRGPPSPVHAQGTYLFRHPLLGEYAFFITSVRASATGVDYEACFSHAL